MNTFFLKSIKELSIYKLENKNIVNLMVGSFTLLHKGHLNIINTMIQKGSSSLIILNKKGSHLDMLDYKNFLESLGIKVLYVVEMNIESYKIKALDFVSIIKESFPILKTIFSGSDWRFGENREGDYRTFISANIDVAVAPFLLTNEKKISSSIIWEGLATSDKFNEAISLLCIKPFTKGEVITTNQQGRKLGFPTANIKPSNSYIPPKGIYLTKTKIEGDPKLYNSITNIGVAPSINDDCILKHETHILDFNQNIYGKHIKCFYIKRVTEERKHKSKKDLINFIQEIKDIAIDFFNE